jgi:hypothetical protein
VYKVITAISKMVRINGVGKAIRALTEERDVTALPNNDMSK